MSSTCWQHQRLSATGRDAVAAGAMHWRQFEIVVDCVDCRQIAGLHCSALSLDIDLAVEKRPALEDRQRATAVDRDETFADGAVPVRAWLREA
jgi:hypothetical protein